MSTIVMSHKESPGRRRSVLTALKASGGPMTINAIAKVLGVHPNTVRFHLDTLVGEGRVELIEPEFNRPGRPPLMFRAIPQMDRSGPRHYRLLAEILAMSLASGRDQSAKAQAAGKAWGRKLTSPVSQGKRTDAKESVDHLVGVLHELGFEPERSESGWGQQIGLRHCPFLELAETRAKIVCPIHLGLMQGVLESLAAPVAVDRLDAFVEPDLCSTYLTLQGEAT